MERNKASRISLNINEPLCFSYTRPVLLTQTLSHLWAFVHAVHSSWNALALLLCLLEYLISRQSSDSASSRKPPSSFPCLWCLLTPFSEHWEHFICPSLWLHVTFSFQVIIMILFLFIYYRPGNLHEFFMSLFYRWTNWGTEKLSNLPKLAQLVNSRV